MWVCRNTNDTNEGLMQDHDKEEEKEKDDEAEEDDDYIEYIIK